MSNKKQSSVDFIFNSFNLLSDADFKAWMLNNYDDIKAMHKEEVINFSYKLLNESNNILTGYVDEEKIYEQTFGGQDNE